MTNLDAIWSRCITPEPDLRPWEWLERNIISMPFSPVPGGLDTSIDPGLRHAIDLICDPSIQLVVLKINVQRWKTLALDLALTWAIKNDPAPTLYLFDRDDNGRDHMQTRLRPLLENTKGVRDLIPQGHDKDKAKNASIMFRNGMSLWIAGAPNKRNLQRRTLRRVFFDECWMYPRDKNPIREGIARTSAFGYLGKVVMASQGSEEGDEFDEFWMTTTKAAWHVPCPECGHVQELKWSNVKFDPIRDDDGNYQYNQINKTVRYECETCDKPWPDADETRRDLNAGGRFVTSDHNAPANRIGLTANAISSMSWAFLVEEYLRAKVIAWAGDIGPLKIFYQKRLALAWGEAGGEDFAIEIKGSGYSLKDAAWNDEGIVAMRAGTLKIAAGPLTDQPGFVRFRTMTVDVQRECFWVSVRSWSNDGRTRLMWAGRVISWDDLDAIQSRFEIAGRFVGVDSGNQPYSEVYPNAAHRRWTCLRGDQRLTFPHKDRETGKRIERYYSTARTVPLSKGVEAKVFHWSGLNCKDILARMLRMPDRWQIPDDISDHCKDYHEQMNAERRVKKNGKWSWQGGKRPNHLWDCEAMQVVFGLMTKVIGSEVEETGEIAEAGDDESDG